MSSVMKMASNTEQYQQLDRDHHLHPFTDFKALGKKGTRVITKAEGIICSGNRRSRNSRSSVTEQSMSFSGTT